MITNSILDYPNRGHWGKRPIVATAQLEYIALHRRVSNAYNQNTKHKKSRLLIGQQTAKLELV